MRWYLVDRFGLPYPKVSILYFLKRGSMTIQISKSLISKLPEGERVNIEQALWDRSGKICWLCEEPLNRASDDIHADHDTPEAEGGRTVLSNLHLAHASCNKAKRNAKTVPIRPYLKLLAFTKKNGGRLKYDGYLNHFNIEPKSIVLTRTDGGREITFELPDGSRSSVPVFSEKNNTGFYEYVFIDLPRESFFNDDACQPRVVRTDHAWSIYSDMQRNVLHEPPSARLEGYALNKPIKVLLFDGQHKTIASWMMGRTSVTVKVYLNMGTPQANELVNSIQAKIKKLPLSPFELAGKMADEWQNKFLDYESIAGPQEVSEFGFLAWLPPTERPRGKAALQSALIQNILSSPDLRIVTHVKKPGEPPKAFSFTEQQLKTKVLEKLLVKNPSREKGDAAQQIRDSEALNIIGMLNLLTDLAFEPSEDNVVMVPIETERARRMAYQSSLAYISMLLRKIWNRASVVTNETQPMSIVLAESKWRDIATAIKRLVDHPVWTAELDRDDKMAAVKSALEKNQEAESAFVAVGLDLAYVVLGKDDHPTYKAYWA